MKEVKKCSISGVAFTMDTDAYEALEAYLDSLKKSYKDTADGAEIVADIEARIAELILSAQDNTRVVEKPLILNIIQQMGSAEDISDQNADRDLHCDTPRIPRRLYRDTENAKLGGVCARHRQIFRHRPRVGAARAVPAAAAHVLRMDSFPALVQPDVRQPVRHLPDLLFHHVVRRPGAPHGTTEARNERREDHCAVHRRRHLGHGLRRPRRRAKPIIAEAVSVFGKVVLILLKIFAGFLVFGLIMGACALIIGLFAVIVGRGESLRTPKSYGAPSRSGWQASAYWRD